MFFNIKTVREGIILLTYFREYNDAHHFACAEHPDLKQIKHRIDSVFSEFEDGLKKRRTHSKYIRRLNENLTNEADILWAKKSQQANIFLWMWLACISEQCNGRSMHFHSGISQRAINVLRRMRFGLLSRDELPIKTPYNENQYYFSSLYMLDLASGTYSEKRLLADAIHDEYKKSLSKIESEFSWISEATENQLHWVLNQFMKERRLKSFLNSLGLAIEDNIRLIPYIYYFWGWEAAEKEIWLIRLKKNYANMKHREKVKDKAPVNIRISPSAKNKLIKLEKRFNRNRSEVIEYLIEQAWADK